MAESSKSELSERELEILRLVASGASNKEIAGRLFISANTVKVHLRNIFSKIGAASRTEAAMYAVKMGLVPGAGPLHLESPPPGESEIPAERGVSVIPDQPKKRRLRWGFLALIAALAGLTLLALFLSQQGSTYFDRSVPSAATPEAASRWQRLDDLPTARSGLGLANLDQHLYAIAGESAEGITGLVEAYSIQANRWQVVRSKPLPVADITVGVIGGRLFVPGGRLASGACTDALEIYDPRQDAWERGASLPFPLCDYALATLEGRLYVFGGWDGKAVVATALRYDPARNAWDTLTPMPTARRSAAAAVASGKIFVIGGFDGQQGLLVNEVFSPILEDGMSDPWAEAAPLPEPRYAMQAAGLADFLLLIGGMTNNTSAPAGLEFLAEIDQWHTIESPPMAAHSFGAVIVGQRLWIVGGKNDQGWVSAVWSYQAMYTVVIPLVP